MKPRLLLIAALAFGLTACEPTDPDPMSEPMTATEPQASVAPDVEYLQASDDENLDLPFSDAVRVGNLLFLSGKIGAEAGSMQVVEGGIQAETRQTMENIQTALERYGATMNDVVKCTVFMADMSEWGAMNEVYVTFFPEHRPARSALGANGLALGARVEIECIAAV